MADKMTRPLVVTLLPSQVPFFELGVACEVFGFDRRDLVRNWYRFKLIAERPIVTSSLGVDIHNLAPLSSMNHAHTVIVLGPGGVPAPPSPTVIAALQAAAKRGARLLS